MHKVLESYVTPKSEAQLKEIYNKIAVSYMRRNEDDNLQQALAGVKKTLSNTRKATNVEFLCFKGLSKPSESSSKSERTKQRDGRDGRDGREGRSRGAI